MFYFEEQINSRCRRKSRQKLAKFHTLQMHSTQAGKHEYEYVGRF